MHFVFFCAQNYKKNKKMNICDRFCDCYFNTLEKNIREI